MPKSASKRWVNEFNAVALIYKSGHKIFAIDEATVNLNNYCGIILCRYVK